MPKFSIIVPVYNVEEYLDACVQSVVGQTCTDFELILVDDGATDRSGAICDRWAKADSRISAVHKQNGGLSSARNEGLRYISGEYVLFLDSDDYWLANDVLETLAQRLEQTGADVLIYNFCKDYEGKLDTPYFREDLQMPSELEDAQTISFVNANNLWIASACNKAIKSKLFDDGQLRFVEGITSEDMDWCARLLRVAQRFDYTGKCVLGYRQRASSISGHVTWNKVSCLFRNVQTCIGMVEGVRQPKAELMKSYAAYQYGVLVSNVATYPACRERQEMIGQIQSLVYVLDWSEEPKIRLIRRMKGIVGFRMTLRLILLKSKIDCIRQKRSD